MGPLSLMFTPSIWCPTTTKGIRVVHLSVLESKKLSKPVQLSSWDPRHELNTAVSNGVVQPPYERRTTLAGMIVRPYLCWCYRQYQFNASEMCLKEEWWNRNPTHFFHEWTKDCFVLFSWSLWCLYSAIAPICVRSIPYQQCFASTLQVSCANCWQTLSWTWAPWSLV